MGLPRASAKTGSRSQELLAHVPASARLVVSVDHGLLSKHRHYVDVLRFLVSQGWGAGLEELSSGGLDLPKDVGLTLTYQLGSGGQGLLLKSQAIEVLRTRSKSTLGADFKADALGGRKSFTLSQRLVIVDLGAQIFLVASPKVARRTLRALAHKKSIVGSKGFKALAKDGRGLGAMVWGVARFSPALRERTRGRGHEELAEVHSLTFGVHGVGPTHVQLHARASSGAAAHRVMEAVQSRIEKKLRRSPMLTLLGAGVLLNQVQMVVQGKTFQSKLSLTVPQVGLLARIGQRIIHAL